MAKRGDKSSKVKIALFELEPWEQEYMRQKLGKYELVFFHHPMAPAIIPKIKDCSIVAVFVYSPINKEEIDSLPKLKMIATMSTGFDHIAIDEAKKNNIAVCNVPAYGENTVAEHTFALILNLSRKVDDAIQKTRKGDFTLEGLRGFDLKGKTLGVIGCGNIGKHVIRIARGFEMDVLVFDLCKDMKLAKSLGFRYASLEDIYKKSDIITLHVPYNQHTHHLIDKKAISMMKKGVYLINTARGGIVDTEALIFGLDKKIVAGAGLDVLEGECLIKEERQLLRKEFHNECDLKTQLEDHILLNKENVLVTPHNAFNSTEALHRIMDTTIENIQSFLKGRVINSVFKK
jgi:D-lactate dehydrogenase